jgi:hypothetical protein
MTTNFRLACSLSLVMVTCLGSGLAVGQRTTAPTTADSETPQTPSLSKLFPEDRAAIDREVQRGEQSDALRASLKLIDRAHERLALTKEGQDRRESGQAFQEAWALGCHLSKQADNPDAKRLFQSRWDSLLKDTKTVALQLGSLNSLCAPELSPIFWESTQGVHDAQTISAYAYAIYQFGRADDLRRAEEWLSTLKDRSAQGSLKNAISYLRYSVSGDNSSPGPAAEPPARPVP